MQDVRACSVVGSTCRPRQSVAGREQSIQLREAFNVDPTTKRHHPFALLGLDEFEDYDFLQVTRRSPVWILDVANDADPERTAPRQFMFGELLPALGVGLSEAGRDAIWACWCPRPLTATGRWRSSR